MKSMTSYKGWKVSVDSQKAPCPYSMTLENMTTGDTYKYDCAGSSKQAAYDYAKEIVNRECKIV